MGKLEALCKLPLSDLLLYKDALEVLSAKYEKEALPMFGMATRFDKLTEYQIKARRNLDIVKPWLTTIYEAIERVTYDSLNKHIENLNNKENKTEKKKRNVKKDSK